MNQLLKAGVFDAARFANPQVLTVLNYHRINDTSRINFDSYAPNVTCSPADFERQLAYLQSHYNIISSSSLEAWMHGMGSIPTHAALITFDDGYADNYQNAYPILKNRSLPALIFLATDFIGGEHPFPWDYAAYCFTHTRCSTATLPVLGEVSWKGKLECRCLIRRWVEACKSLPKNEQLAALSFLPRILDINLPADAFSGLYLTWDQVREMSLGGIEFGSHTASHPILSRLAASEAEDELIRSRQRIENETNKPVYTIGYPNGRRQDISPLVLKRVLNAGYQLGFSLEPGLMRFPQIRKQPLEIRRIFLSASDTFPRFAAKLVFPGLLTQ